MNYKKIKQKYQFSFFKEKAKKFGDCKKLLDGQCSFSGRKYKDAIACVEFVNGGL